MSTRRDFVKQSSLLTAGFFLPNDSFFKAKKNIGLQLYTLRGTISKDPRSVLASVAKLGYKQVETFGYGNGQWFGLTPLELKGVLKDNGLTSPSGHTFMGSFLLKDGWEEKWKAAVADSKTLGQEYIVIPYLEDSFRTIENYKKLAQALNKAGELAKAGGSKIAYHNHDFEFTESAGEKGFDILLNDTDPKLVHFELDIYWAVKAGYDPIALFKKSPGRFAMWHIKDIDKTEKKFFTEVGNGSIDWKPIFANAKTSGMKYFFVEQDVTPGDPIESVTKSIDYLKNKVL
jgi:sugar phosphate isomerase/epimerase